MASGNVAIWIGKGSLIPDLANVLTMEGFTPKSKNDMKLTTFETTSASRKDPDSI
jgi:hypothetical protein